MAEVKFYKLLLNHDALKTFLIENNMVIDANKAHIMGLRCRNINCNDRSGGFYNYERKRNLKEPKSELLCEEGQNILSLSCLRCKSCSTYLSPRTNGFLSYMDIFGRANSKLAPEKILQMIFHWAADRRISDAENLLDITNKILIDWFNHCRNVCKNSNLYHYSIMLLGDGCGQRLNGDSPICVVQIDECLLRGKRMYNRGRLLNGDENISHADRDEWNQLNRYLISQNDDEMDPVRNYGRRIEGPWIFGLVECWKLEDRRYVSGEVRLFKVDRRDSNTLLPIILQHVRQGSMICSDQWGAYRGLSNHGFHHETIIHSENFITSSGVNTQNIERQWSSLKLKIIKNMKGTSENLLESHLEEFCWRSRKIGDIFDIFKDFLLEASLQHPIEF